MTLSLAGRQAASSIIVALCLLVASTGLALAASLSVVVDLSGQEMTVCEQSRIVHRSAVSTARGCYCTPVDTYRSIRLERMWYSTIYDNAPMPHSIFFYGGYAIHGTTEIANLGQPASHGCVRLNPDNARILFNLVLDHGRNATQIVIGY